MRCPKHAGSGKSARVLERVVRDVELVAWGRPEALLAVPGHVLDHKERPVGDQDVVEYSVANDSSIEFLNHFRKNGESARRRQVVIVDKNTIGALFPWLYGRIDRFLYIRAVEVNSCSLRKIVEGPWKA